MRLVLPTHATQLSTQGPKFEKSHAINPQANLALCDQRTTQIPHGDVRKGPMSKTVMDQMGIGHLLKLDQTDA